MTSRKTEVKHSAQSSMSNSPTSPDVNEQGKVTLPTRAQSAMNYPNTGALSEAESADLKWEVGVHMENFRFFLDLGLKAVVLFYAIAGGILSVYFAKNTEKNNEVLKILLWIPFIVSMILGTGFFVGAGLMKKATRDLTHLCRKAQMKKIPDFPLLTWLFVVFGALFFVTGAALVWLYYRLV